MKKTTGLLILGTFSLLLSLSALHGCGAKDDPAPAASTPMTTTPPAATPAKFTIVGAGS
jgi:hypothetical protein